MDKLVVPMSSSGHCIRALSASYLQVEHKAFPSWLESTAEEGNIHEDAIKAKLRNKGYVIEDNREECKICKERYGTGRKGIHVEIDSLHITLIGHLDGIISHPDNPLFGTRILECKSMSQNEFYRWTKGRFEEFPNYAAQLTCYMSAKNLSAYYYVKNRNLGNTDILEINQSPSNIIDIVSMLEVLNEYVSHGKLCDAEYKADNVECQRCQFDKLCLPPPKEFNPEVMNNLKKNLEERDNIKQIVRDAYNRLDVLETDIKLYLKESGLKQRQFGYTISLTLNQTITTYPKDNLIEVGVTEEQLINAKKVGEPFDRLYIKNLNKED